jgi:hypothetical protein
LSLPELKKNSDTQSRKSEVKNWCLKNY